MTNGEKSILYDFEGSIARVTLNRPDKRNALNDEMIEGLKAALSAADENDSVKAITITGNGQDFCSGADLLALQKISEGSVQENADDARSLMELFLQMRLLRVPVIALATACDIVLASSSARFGYPEVKIGFVPAIVMAILRRNLSEKRAFELVTRGVEIGAEEAKQLGLVNQVFKDETFETDVTTYVKGFEKTSKSAVSLTKSLLYQIDCLAFLEACETGVDVNVIARMTVDCQKGIANFLKKK